MTDRHSLDDLTADDLAEVILGALENAWADDCGNASLADLAKAAALAVRRVLESE